MGVVVFRLEEWRNSEVSVRTILCMMLGINGRDIGLDVWVTVW